MGHANLKNISKAINKLLHQRVLSIKEMVDHLEKNSIFVNASEGQYRDRSMLGFACEDVMFFLLAKEAVTPVGMNKKQTKIFKDWKNEDTYAWDYAEDNESGEYGILDSIKWQAITDRLPVLGNVSH